MAVVPIVMLGNGKYFFLKIIALIRNWKNGCEQVQKVYQPRDAHKVPQCPQVVLSLHHQFGKKDGTLDLFER